MADLELKRVLRGATRTAVEALTNVVGPFRVEDTAGRVLVGEPDVGDDRRELTFEGRTIGAVFGAAEADVVVTMVEYLYERELEKRGLAAETLDRYKELALLYDLGDSLSRVVEVEDVAKMVVDEAVEFMNASSASILLLGRGELTPLATTGESALPVDVANADECVQEVLRTGRAEFVTRDSRSLMCAPLRTGEEVYGVLMVANEGSTVWTAGDLKLIASLAAKAADGITRALLHRAQMREQTLRGQIERFVSADLIPATAPRSTEIALLYCDLSQVTRTAAVSIDADVVLGRLEQATATSLALLLGFDATLNLARGEMLVATFAEDEFASSAARAVDAAIALATALDGRNGGPCEEPVGIAVVRAEWADDQQFLGAIGVAATLQGADEGRILVDEHIAQHLSGHAVAASANSHSAYEVTP